MEGAAVLLESPCAVDFFAVDLTVVHDQVLPEVLFLEVSHAVAFNPALQNEFTDIVMAFASHYLTWSGLERHPSHFMVLAVLLVVALPHGVRLELVRLRDVIALRRDAGGLRHRVAGDRDVGDGCLHHGLSHWLHHGLHRGLHGLLHRLLHGRLHWGLHGGLHHGLAHGLHHWLAHGLHHRLSHRLHHRLLLHHHGLLLHHLLLLHLKLWLLLLGLRLVGGRRG